MFHVKQTPIFAFCNQKGGVGKTTSAVNIATCLAQSGHKILLIDLDPQGNATSGVGEDKNAVPTTIYPVMLGEQPLEGAIKTTAVPNLSLVPSNAQLAGAEVELISLSEREFQLSKAVGPVRDRFDFIFIDCPPSLGLLTVNALTASTFIFIPLQCEYYALEGLGQLLQTYQLVKKNLNPNLELAGVLLTMADFRTNLTEQVIKEVRDYFKEKVFSTIIPRSVRLSEAPSFGKPGVIYDPLSRGSKCYHDVAKEFEIMFHVKHSKPAEEELMVKEGGVK